MAFISLAPSEVDAKSPVDDLLMGKIKDDLDDLNSRVVVAGANPIVFNLDGLIKYVTHQRRALCGLITNKEFTPSRCRFTLKKSGTAGNFQFDIRKHTSPRTPITAISNQFEGSTTSVSRQAAAVSTQSIVRAAAQIATQSITYAKANIAVQSITVLGPIADYAANPIQYNLASSVDVDSIIGDGFEIAGCTAGGNNGTFTIIEKNRGGGNNIVIDNASGVAQTGAAGTVQAKIMSYNFVNPVDAFFAAGRMHLFSGHTSGANNDTFLVLKINQGGNNIWLKNNGGVTQAGVAGAADTNLWKFGLSAAAVAADFIIGQNAATSGHSNASNDGSLPIIARNSGGNNLVLYNPSGVAQGGAAGSIDTNLLVYNLGSNPTGNVAVNDNLFMLSHANAANDGSLVARALSSSSVTVYNPTGATQGSGGTVTTFKKLIQFEADQSANYTTDSFVEFDEVVGTTWNKYYTRSPFKVVAVNHGGGANYNIVVEAAGYPTQVSPSGYILTEARSLFNSLPLLASDLTGVNANEILAGETTDLKVEVVPANTPLAFYIWDYPNGDPRDFTAILT